MAAPTYVASGTFTSGTGAVSPALPAGWAQDDILIITVLTKSSEPVTAPAGWAHVTNSPEEPASNFPPRISVLWKRAGSSESAPTIADPGTGTLARMHAFRGCVATGNPWDITASNSNTNFQTAFSAPSVTTTVADTLVVVCYTGSGSPGDGSTVTASGWTNATLGTVTERTDNTAAPNAAFIYGMAMATGVMTSAGSTGATTGSTNIFTDDAIITLALKATSGTPASGDFALQLSSVTEDFAATRDIPTGSFAMQLGGASVTMAGIASPPSGDIAMQLSQVSEAFVGVADPGGAIGVQLPSVAMAFAGATEPLGGFAFQLAPVSVQFTSETTPFGEHVIHVEPEGRAFLVIDDGGIGLIDIKRSQVTDA